MLKIPQTQYYTSYIPSVTMNNTQHIASKQKT